MKKRKFGKIALFALPCISVIACMLFASCNKSEPTNDTGEAKVEVIRVAEDIPVGTKITSKKIEKVLVNKEDLPVGTITNEEDVLGKYAVNYIYAGDYFFQTKLASTKPVEEEEESKDEDNKLNFADAGYVLVSDYVKADTGEDVSDDIQKLIDENPNRTLFFTDGVYMISKSLTTSSDPDKTVSFKLSNYAQFKATSDWTYGEPLFKLGATGTPGDRTDVGNCVLLEGGILNGDNRADGIWVMNGGTVSIRYTAIKFAVDGIHVKANEDGSGPTVDVTTVNIIGSGTLDSVGVILETDNNTLTNMRIAANQICIKLFGNNNALRNLHPLYIFREGLNSEETYKESIAFYDAGTQNFYDNCYNDQFATGFYLVKGNRSVFDCCFNFWYRPGYDFHNAFVCEGKFDAVIRMTSAEFRSNREGVVCNYLLVGESGGQGTIDAAFYYADGVTDQDVTKDYLINDPITD